MNLIPSLEAKQFFRFTGPPENWLTAIKFMTWGLEEHHLERWKQINTGDVFFIHSTGVGTSLFDNAKSGIIGLGVVGSNFSIKKDFLWMQEFKEQRNKWPLLVPFSEIYLFSEIPNRDSWDGPSLTNTGQTRNSIDKLLANHIPLSKITGFPHMGAFSSVSLPVAQKILFDKKPLFVFEDDFNREADLSRDRPTRLLEINSAAETFRYANTLKIFDAVRRRIVQRGTSTFVRNNDLLARAEDSHSSIIEQLISIFKSRGYKTLSNKFVDLFAHNEEKSFLFEVKSTENKNFKKQARKGVIQLLEYDHFEITKYSSENQIDFEKKFSILVLSQEPKDEAYVHFINNLNIGVAQVTQESLNPIGKDLGFTEL